MTAITNRINKKAKMFSYLSIYLITALHHGESVFLQYTSTIPIMIKSNIISILFC